MAPNSNFGFLQFCSSVDYDKPYQDDGRRIMALIFLQCIRDWTRDLSFKSTKARRVAAKRDAKNWLFDDERDYPTSFSSICDALDFERDDIRKKLKANKPTIRKDVKYWFRSKRA